MQLNKSYDDLNILVLTLNSRPDRYWWALGMLDAMNYKIKRCHTLMGHWCRDYKDLFEMVDTAIEGGFEGIDYKKKEENRENLRHMAWFGNLWSAWEGLNWIKKQDHPVLLMEDDFKLNIDWTTMKMKIAALPDNIEIAILRGKEPTPDNRINRHWCSGAYPVKYKVTSIIFTPRGAKEALKVISNAATLENIGILYPANITAVANTESGILVSSHTALQHLTCCPGEKQTADDWVEFTGIDNHEFTRRWTRGVMHYDK